MPQYRASAERISLHYSKKEWRMQMYQIWETAQRCELYSHRDLAKLGNWKTLESETTSRRGRARQNCKAISVDLDKENASHLANRMYDQYSGIFGGFVVRPVKQLPSLPLSKLHELRVTVRDQMLSPRPTLGSFYLANVERKPQVLCRTFIGQKPLWGRKSHWSLCEQPP